VLGTWHAYPAAARRNPPCEHVFVTAQGSPLTRFYRALERRNVFLADSAARELEGGLPVEDAYRLVVLYAEARDDRFERAALRWLERYIAESSPSLTDVAAAASTLVEKGRQPAA
jgi:hypothetical protein